MQNDSDAKTRLNISMMTGHTYHKIFEDSFSVNSAEATGALKYGKADFGQIRYFAKR